MRAWPTTGTVAALLLGLITRASVQAPAIRPVDEKTLREYAGVYQWEPDAFLYLQMWEEFSGFGKPRLMAIDESGDLRTLYPIDRDQFFTGPGIAIATSIESRIEFQRDAAGKIVSLAWQREGGAPRTARRVEIEKHEDVRFPSGSLQLAGTLISPATGAKHPAIILVHGSGAETREHLLPYARFLVRRGIAVLGYDKRGVGGSTGDWNSASFDDLAGDAVAAFEYLKTRPDIDARQIGLLGLSQAGWIMPLAAVRAKDMAFLISISGAGIPAAETTIDQARNEMTMTGMPRENVEQIIDLLKLQYEFARTGRGWDEYAAAREKLAARMGKPPDTIPGTPDHPYIQFIKRLYFYDPAPTLRQLQVPTLAIWGELDNNIVAEKNKAAWESALKAGGNRDYTLVILPKGNHDQIEAKTGSNAEIASLQRFVPAYFATVQEWLAKRLRVSTQAAASADPIVDPDAYGLYSLQLSATRPERRVAPAPLIIQSTTERWDPPNCFPEPVKSEWQEVLAAYRRVNAKTWTIERRLQLDAPYELLSKDAIRAAFGGGANWEAFDRAHPGSGGYIMLSAIGFNAARNRAMFYAGYSCGNLCGAGTVHFFEKVDGLWKRATPMNACAFVS